MAERYAIYFAPDRESDLWKRAVAWLGRDPATGEMMDPQAPPWMDPADFTAATESPRRYGFHATLKAPFELAEGTAAKDLFTDATRFAETQSPVDIGTSEVRDYCGFLAIMPKAQTPALTGFAGECVSHFERRRAPLSQERTAKRESSDLTPRQAELLEKYGYPYVMDQFAFHMTLSDKLDARTSARLLPDARDRFADCLSKPLVLDRIAIYHEEAAGAPFKRLVDFPLTGKQ